jgi:hypothetical protein
MYVSTSSKWWPCDIYPVCHCAQVSHSLLPLTAWVSIPINSVVNCASFLHLVFSPADSCHLHHLPLHPASYLHTYGCKMNSVFKLFHLNWLVCTSMYTVLTVVDSDTRFFGRQDPEVRRHALTIHQVLCGPNFNFRTSALQQNMSLAGQACGRLQVFSDHDFPFF